MLKNAVLYIHGKGGSAAECEHYKPLFPECDVIGLDYRTFTPWETGAEIRSAVKKLKAKYDSIILIASSIGAFFSMNADIDSMIEKAYFISPIVNMERLITNMMTWANVTEDELKEKKIIHTSFGEDLSWEYLYYLRTHPIKWNAPTAVLYGSKDNLTSYEIVADFSEKHNAKLTVMKNGEHWFHTDEQMRFLDNWIKTLVFGNDTLRIADVTERFFTFFTLSVTFKVQTIERTDENESEKSFINRSRLACLVCIMDDSDYER